MKKEGKKEDENKIPVGELLSQFPNALKLAAMCSNFGHERYKEFDENWDNWSKVENGIFRYKQARGRHLLDEKQDFSGIDVDSKLPSIGHTLWNNLALVELLIKENKITL